VPAAREVHAAAWSDAADGLYIHGGLSVGQFPNNALDDLHFYSRQARQAREGVDYLHVRMYTRRSCTF